VELKIFGESSDAVFERMRERHVFIYGDGDYAHSLARFIRARGVTVTAHLIDDTYYKEESHSHHVMRLSAALPAINAREAYLIWGIARASKLREAIRSEEIKEAWITYDAHHMWQDRQYARKHATEFQAARELFDDELSQKTFDDYLKIYDGDIRGDLENIVDGTYYNDLTRSISYGGAFVDCGAYNGDSALAFLRQYGRERKVFAFEPDRANYDAMAKNLEGLNVVPVCAGVWSEDTVLHFAAGGGELSCIEQDGDVVVPVRTIDGVVKEDKVSFIKMDVEGSEFSALQGAAHTIRRDMPTLAISAYHRQEDLVTIPQWIHAMKNESIYYKLYLRHHGCTVPELVIYGIPTAK